jgi:hypothetical protein
VSALVDAVRAVEHDATCSTRAVPTLSQFQEKPGPCNCSRDARIAKGVEAAVIVACTWHLEPEYLNDRNQVLMYATVLTAFVEASQ